MEDRSERSRKESLYESKLAHENQTKSRYVTFRKAYCRLRVIGDSVEHEHVAAHVLKSRQHIRMHVKKIIR